MKKPIILLITLFTIINSQSFAQNQKSNFTYDIDNFFNDNGLKENLKNYDEVKGSPYKNDNFQKANISLKPDLLFYVKYNAFVDQMEVMGKNDQSFALNKSIDNLSVHFIEDKKVYQVYSYSKKGQTLSRFFNVLNPNSKIVLLKKEEVTLKEKVVAKTPYDKDKPARFLKSSDSYYYKFTDKVIASELPKKKKDIAKLFPKLEKEILKFIKSEKIKLSKETDLVKLFKELNRLNNKS